MRYGYRTGRVILNAWPDDEEQLLAALILQMDICPESRKAVMKAGLRELLTGVEAFSGAPTTETRTT